MEPSIETGGCMIVSILTDTCVLPTWESSMGYKRWSLHLIHLLSLLIIGGIILDIFQQAPLCLIIQSSWHVDPQIYAFLKRPCLLLVCLEKNIMVKVCEDNNLPA